MGELLQRVAHVASACTPHLQVAPVFALYQGTDACTPGAGDRYAEGVGGGATRAELGALFAVVGTPPWRSVETLTSPAWRGYLHRLPVRAPTLFRRFGAAGEPAVHLLSRLLAFEPSQRASAEEALAHEYLWEPPEPAPRRPPPPMFAAAAAAAAPAAAPAPEGGGGGGETAATPQRLCEVRDAGVALARLEAVLSSLAAAPRDAACETIRLLLQEECEQHAAMAAAAAATAAAGDAPGSRSSAASAAAAQADEDAPPPQEESPAARESWRFALPGGDEAPAVRGERRRSSDGGGEPEPERHLRAGRHSEWASIPLAAGPTPGPRWGVTAVPPGLDLSALPESLRSIVTRQQER